MVCSSLTDGSSSATRLRDVTDLLGTVRRQLRSNINTVQKPLSVGGFTMTTTRCTGFSANKTAWKRLSEPS